MFNTEGQQKQAALEELCNALRSAATAWVNRADQNGGELTAFDAAGLIGELGAVLSAWRHFAEAFELREADLPADHPFWKA